MGMTIITESLESIDHGPAAKVFSEVDPFNSIKQRGQAGGPTYEYPVSRDMNVNCRQVEAQSLKSVASKLAV